MSSVKKIFVVGAGALGLAILAGCGATAPVPVVTTNNVLIAPPKSQLAHVTTPVPPDKAAFAAADGDTRLDMMRKDDAAVREQLKNANDRFDAIQGWIDDEIKIYQNNPNTTWAGQAPSTSPNATATGQ